MFRLHKALPEIMPNSPYLRT